MTTTPKKSKTNTETAPQSNADNSPQPEPVQNSLPDIIIAGNKRSELFPEQITKAALFSEMQTGCPAAVTLAQYALESGYGKHTIGRYNYFGIKWAPHCGFDAVEMHTKEWNGSHYVPVIAKFIDFPDANEAFDYHGQLVMNPKGPYDTAVPFAHDWVKFLQRLSPIYATDPHYFTTCMDIIEQWRLWEFGSVQPKKEPAAQEA